MRHVPRLYLLRHAKSSWKDPELTDHDRPLAARGARAAAALARHFDAAGIAPDLVLCSTARRARDTLDQVAPAAGEVRFEPELYGASARSLLERLRQVPPATGSVLVIGHNPELEDLALALARPSAGRDEIEAKYPTGALVALELPGWAELGRGTATLTAFVRPRDLE